MNLQEDVLSGGKCEFQREGAGRGLCYISHGNIPSKWAHTMQSMKMAEALASLVPDFELVTQIHWRDCWRPRFDFEAWYGISKPFRVKRLITRCAPRKRVFEHVFSEAFAEAAAKYVKRKQPGLTMTRCHLMASRLAAMGLPFVFETHASEQDEVQGRVSAVVGARSLRAVVTISEQLREKYADLGIPPGKIMVLPDAVDVERWQSAPDRQAARRTLGLSPDAFYAVYCGHLYDHRGVEDILVAARQLPDVKFLLVGGWERDVERRRQEASGMRNVTFAGFVPNSQVPQYAAAADCLLLPYSRNVPRVDTMSPLKLFESMASGRPIIASDLPAIRRHVVHLENGILVVPDNGVAIANAVRLIREGQIDAKSLADRALSDVQRFTWAARAKELLSMLDG